jgi:hypothetical protein
MNGVNAVAVFDTARRVAANDMRIPACVTSMQNRLVILATVKDTND